MRIVFVTPSPFPYYAGGVETWMYNVIKRIADDNEVIVLSPSFHTMDIVFPDIIDAVRYVNFRCLKDAKIFRLILRRKLSIIDSFYRQHTLRKKLRGILEEKDEMTYVISVDPIFVGSVINPIKQEFPNIKYITSIRTLHLDIMSASYPLFRSIFRKYEKESIIMSDLLLVNGYDTKKLYEEKYGVITHVMKNGADVTKISSTTIDDAYEIDANSKSILSVATLIGIKGVYDLLKAGKVYREKYGEDFTMYFIGKGDQGRMYKQAEELGIRNNVICLGHKNNPIPYIKKAKINVCLSGGSGFSMSMLEAMASGVPVIALDTPVYQQLNILGNLPLVEEKNPEALADCIHDVFQNYDAYRRSAAESLQVVKNYDWSVVISDFMRYLNEI